MINYIIYAVVGISLLLIVSMLTACTTFQTPIRSDNFHQSGIFVKCTNAALEQHPKDIDSFIAYQEACLP
jgi:hypothetical protein